MAKWEDLLDRVVTEPSGRGNSAAVLDDYIRLDAKNTQNFLKALLTPQLYTGGGGAVDLGLLDSTAVIQQPMRVSLNPAGAISITNFINTYGLVDGQPLVLINKSAFIVTINDGGNFGLGAGNATLDQNESLTIWWDETDALWYGGAREET